MLQLYSLQKRYGSKLVLDISELSLEAGLYWLRGSNGSGKTTLLRILAGIIPFDGEVHLQGRTLRDPVSATKSPTAYRRLIAWADAEPQYPGFLTGQELLNFYRNILHPESARVKRLIESFEVGAWFGRPIAAWSSGMTKKLSLILALLVEPVLTLLDEPFTTLDEPGRTMLNKWIRDSRSTGTSFLISSHQAMGPGLLPETVLLTLDERAIELKVSTG